METDMREHRDPYAAPPAPRERGGPLLRFAIVAALLGAAVWAYTAYSQGPGLTEAADQDRAALADAGAMRGYATQPAEPPEAVAAPQAPSAAGAPAAEPPAPASAAPPA
jgi:hypothetical protein